MFPVINLLRFVAAFWVLIFHARIHFGDLPDLWPIMPIIEQGVLAMSLFFMLSGFILSYRYSGFTEPGSWSAFYKARVARLYPVYLFMGIVTIWTLGSTREGFLLAEWGAGGQLIWLAIVVGLFVLALQAWFPAFFSVWNFGGSWSLSVEAFFYSMFPALREKFNSMSNGALVAVIYGTPLVLILILVGMIASLHDEKVSSIVFYSVPIYRLPEFLLGIAGYCYFLERRGNLNYLKVAAGASAGIGLILLYFVGDLPGNIDYGAFFVLPFLFAFVVFAKPFQLPTLVSSTFNYLGSVSYCVYIVQFGTVPLYKAALTGSNVEFKWFIFICTNLLLAVLVYHFVERPAHGYLRTKLSLRGS